MTHIHRWAGEAEGKGGLTTEPWGTCTTFQAQVKEETARYSERKT